MQKSKNDTLVILNRHVRNGEWHDVFQTVYLVKTPAGTRINSSKDLSGILRQTVQAFLETPVGKDAWETAGQDFDWGDIENYIPYAWLAKNGVYRYADGMNLETVGRIAVIDVENSESFDPPERIQ